MVGFSFESKMALSVEKQTSNVVGTIAHLHHAHSPNSVLSVSRHNNDNGVHSPL